MKKQKKLLVDIDNTRESEQIEVMKQIISEGVCPFCMEHFKKYNSQDILKEGKYWIVTTNKWPYKNTKVHLLLIYKEHAEHISEMDPESGKELIEMIQWAANSMGIPGGGLAFRFGDTDYSAGSVQHLHAQLIQPDIQSAEYEPVRVKLGKNKDKLTQRG